MLKHTQRPILPVSLMLRVLGSVLFLEGIANPMQVRYLFGIFTVLFLKTLIFKLES